MHAESGSLVRTACPCGRRTGDLHVLRAQPADMSNPNAPASLEPGHIVAGKKNVWVGTSTEPLELLEVKAQGKKAMRAADWARGAHLDNAFCE